MNNTIFHIQTGGTIGGCVPEYPEIEKLALLFWDNIDFKKHIKNSFNLQDSYESSIICHKDSREITEEDRINIVEEITKNHHQKKINKFLITHGTFTMPETGKYILENLPKATLEDMSIIITGSMFPWNIIGSDAPMNLGASIACLTNLENLGVKICMHAKLFNPNKVTKDLNKLIFQDT